MTAPLFLVDSHCHLNLTQFSQDRDAVVARAREVGVRVIINLGIDLETSREAIALAERYECVYAAVGVHPNSCESFGDVDVMELRRLAAHPKVVAIGEIGLDYYWDKVEATQQKRALRAQLALAADIGLPVIIHSRESNDDVEQVLRTWVTSDDFRRSPLAAKAYPGVLHAFSGDLRLAQEAYRWGFVLSLGGPITFKNAHDLHALAPQLDLGRLMLETDAPYLTPHPHRGQRNEPAYVPLICETMARLCTMKPTEIAQASTMLALRFFGLDEIPEGDESCWNLASAANGNAITLSV